MVLFPGAETDERSDWKENLEVLFGSLSVTKSASKDTCWQRKEKIEVRRFKIV